ADVSHTDGAERSPYGPEARRKGAGVPHRAGRATSTASRTAPAELTDGRSALRPMVSSSRPRMPAVPYFHCTSCSKVTTKTAERRARTCTATPGGVSVRQLCQVGYQLYGGCPRLVDIHKQLPGNSPKMDQSCSVWS